MKKLLNGLILVACSGIAMAQPPCSPVVTLNGNITASRTLYRDTVYRVSGCVPVSNGAQLSIQDGTLIEFQANSILMILEDATINALGTASDPIIMTSGVGNPGSRSVVSNAGLVVAGNAPINIGSTLNLPCSETLTVGSNGSGSSGTIQYLQLHYLGGINTSHFGAALTLAGVGSGTTLENIQVTNSGLTGINIIGGEPVLTEIVTQDNAENGLFVSYGAQVALSGYLENRRNAGAHHTNGSYGIKIQNNIATPAATPVTQFNMTNGSIIGPKLCTAGTLSANFKDGILIDNNASASITNSVLAGWPQRGLFINGADCIAKTGTDNINFSYNSFFANTTDYDALPASTAPLWNGTYSGCESSMALWLSGGSAGCAETGNQVNNALSDLGYDESICADYCDPEFVQHFVLTEDTDLDAPNGSSIYDDRGAVQFSDLFTWTVACPLEAVYCTESPMSLPAPQLHFAPNPARSQCTVGFASAKAGKIQVTVLDKVSGSILHSVTVYAQQAGQQEVMLSVAGLKEGVYTVQVQTPTGVLYGQLVVQ